MTPERSSALATFLDASGWGNARRSPLAGDASFRRYERVQKSTGEHAVLMDAPPPQEDVRPFVRVARHLMHLGLSAPKIFAADEEHGFLLLEDLGDDTYTRLLARGHDEHALYALATDALIHLNNRPVDKAVPVGVDVYGRARLLEEVDRLNTWYRPLVEAPPLSDEAQQEYMDLWDAIFPHAWSVPESLVLFDYHVDNLLLIPGRDGVAACGLLDFQDGVRGPVTYDLMSLLEDARRDIAAPLVSAMKQRYLAAFPNIPVDAFNTSWAVMAAQRHVRVIGTFARLYLRDNKPDYLVHMPRLWRYMDACLEHPVLTPLKVWLDGHLPVGLRQVTL